MSGDDPMIGLQTEFAALTCYEEEITSLVFPYAWHMN